MFIKEIKNFDAESGEADVIVSDNRYEVMCYYFPAEVDDCGTNVKSIYSLFAKSIMRVTDNEYAIIKLNDYYSYHLQGKVIDNKIPMISIGEIRINLDTELPKDIENGDFVEFDVQRLSCEI